MEFADVIALRRSVRDYRPDPVPDDALARILDAARLAPSACNKQPWHLYVVRDAATRQALFPEARRAWAAAAPLTLVACSLPEDAWVRGCDEKNHADVDLSIFVEHLVLAAANEGLGTCWICAFDPDVVRAALHLPAAHTPVAMTPLGVPTAVPDPRPRKALDEFVTWR
jgi:nitroreductase